MGIGIIIFPFVCSEETSVPDNTQINDMMACNEAEFTLYQQMDKHREELRNKKVTPLMAASAVPDWAKMPDMWQPRHQQLLLMSEQAQRVRKGGAEGTGSAQQVHDYTIADVGDDDDDSKSVDSAAATERRRKRKFVAYSDGLSDAQFISMVERTGRVGFLTTDDYYLWHFYIYCDKRTSSTLCFLH